MLESNQIVDVLFKLSFFFLFFAALSPIVLFFAFYSGDRRKFHRFFINWASAFAAVGLGLKSGFTFLTSILLGVLVSAAYVFLFPKFLRRFRQWRLGRKVQKTFEMMKKAELNKS